MSFLNTNKKIYELKTNDKIETIQFCKDISSIKHYVNWIDNRPPDQTRINEIMKYYIENHIDIIPGIISIWYNGTSYQIYDGIHRFLAAKDLVKTMKCIIKITSTNNMRHIKKDFNNINNSVSLPSIYIEDNADKKFFCEAIVNNLVIVFPTFVSSSKKPNKPNFNRDAIIDWLSDLPITFSKDNVNFYNQHLSNINEKAKKELFGKNKKCDEHSFYLFLMNRRDLEKEMLYI